MAERKAPGVYLYASYRNQFNLLTLEDRGRLVTAMLDYIEYGELHEQLPPVVEMAFSFMKDTIDRDLEKYNKRIEVNRHNGNKGGRPPKISEDANPEEPKKPNGFTENPEEPKKPNVNVNINDNINDNISVSVNKNGDGTHTPNGGYEIPSFEDVAAYCREIQATVDPRKFYDYYSGSGWKASGQPIEDWKAKLRFWDSEDRQKGKHTRPENIPGYNEEPDPLDGKF